jgi:hypothetical protein
MDPTMGAPMTATTRDLERLAEALAYTERVSVGAVELRPSLSANNRVVYAYGYLAQSVRVYLEAAGVPLDDTGPGDWPGGDG